MGGVLGVLTLIEFIVIVFSLGWIAFMGRPRSNHRRIPLILASAVTLAAAQGVVAINNGEDPLYIGMIVLFGQIILFPLAALSLAAAAWFWSRNKLEQLKQHGRSS